MKGAWPDSVAMSFSCSFPRADVGFVAIDKRSLGTLYVTQPHALRAQLICAHAWRCVVDRTTQGNTCVVQTEKRNHVVLIHAVTGYADTADQRVVPIDGDAAGKNLQPIG